MDLFKQIHQDHESGRGDWASPLPDRMRPKTLEEFIGQDHLLAKGMALQQVFEQGLPVSLIFWGPPGSGKTTLARLIAPRISPHFVEYSAVLAGIKQIKDVIRQAEILKKTQKRPTLLFIDEIHRFNKAQQDAFLPHVENGTIVLIGATTENPSFEVISALLSRTRIFILKPLTKEQIVRILQNAIKDEERGLGRLPLEISEDVLEYLAIVAGGDARVALSTLELAVKLSKPGDKGMYRIDHQLAAQAMQKKPVSYDKAGEQHFNLISAFHKSLRGSDPDAALYWLARMLEGGEDPLYIARRMVRFATEDVGLADPRALSIAIAARDAYHFLGSPEGELALAECAIYLATAPKSNRIYQAFGKAKDTAAETGSLPAPLHICNAPTPLMEAAGYGKGYQYDHDCPDAYSGQDFFPESLIGTVFYEPSEYGYESEISKRIEWWKRRRSGGDSVKKS